MKKVMRNKKVIAMMVVGLVAILVTASGVIASPPAHAVDGDAYITLDPSHGVPGAEVALRGYGFTADAWVDIYYYLNGSRIWVDALETDADGDFAVTFRVPESCEGDHIVLAEDEHGITAYAVFTVVLRINYQGQLTDSGGNPLNGTYDMEFGFYRGPTTSSQAGATITRNDVEVTNGLFSVKLDVDQEEFDGQELWLEVTVEGETLSPRQEILPVPYALSLKPGAHIRGDVEGWSVLNVYNRSGNGLQGQSEDRCGVIGYSSDGAGVMGETDADFNAGVLGRNTGSGVGVAGYSESGAAISATGTGIIESTADSYIFIPGTNFVKKRDTYTTRWDCTLSGAASFWSGATAGYHDIYIPVTVPGVLYGQEVTVEELTIYYKCQDGTQNYITSTFLCTQTDVDYWLALVSDYTDRTSNTATSYTLTATGNNVLSSDQGILSLRLGLQFVDDTNYIQIGGVRLRLSHS